jgi:hypothetical protein
MNLTIDSVPLIDDNEVMWPPGNLFRYYEGSGRISGNYSDIYIAVEDIHTDIQTFYAQCVLCGHVLYV